MDRDSDLGRTVSQLTGSPIRTSRRVSGGDVASSYQLTLDDGRRVFAKTHPNPPAHFFDTEARGLHWLSESGAVRVPHVLGVRDEPALLVLEWIDEAHRPPDDDTEFGRALAAMHQLGAPQFGRTDGRTTGSRGLPNDPCDTWVEFYSTRRLLPLIRLASDGDIYQSEELAVFESVAQRLDALGGPLEALRSAARQAGLAADETPRIRVWPRRTPWSRPLSLLMGRTA